MNELSSLGLILLLALAAGHLVKFLRIPEVSGYILAGVALGPSVLGWISHENLNTLGIFSEVALGLILFSVGAVFDLSRFLKVGRRIVLLTVIESSLAALLVGIAGVGDRDGVFAEQGVPVADHRAVVFAAHGQLHRAVMLPRGDGDRGGDIR